MLAVKIARRQQSVGCLTFRALSSDQASCFCPPFLFLSLFQLASVPISFRSVCVRACVLRCHFPLSQPLLQHQRHGSIVYFLHTDVREGFYVVKCGGELCLFMFANADAVMSVCERVWVGSVLLNFQRFQTSTHLIATHCIVTHVRRYGTLSADSPSLLHFPLLVLSLFLNNHSCL